ncbi:MAG: virulence factor family protein [Methylococcales bacterium]|nr:virulence factor family protein [Methylococcales bacterium]MDD5754788.1 virulence factor family protein [Methylococcales bacterium]
MKSKKRLLVYLLLSLAVIGVGIAIYRYPPIFQKSITTRDFGNIEISNPLWNSKGVAFVFVDTQKFSAVDFGHQSSATEMTTVIIDSRKFFENFNAETKQCLDAPHIATSIEGLLKMLPTSSKNSLVVAGIAEGALIPFINAQSESNNSVTNLSIGFTVDLPNELVLCPPLVSEYQNQKHRLIASPNLENKWRSVWTDQPEAETGIFIKALGNVDTRIAAYDTPLDSLLVEELNANFGQNNQSSSPMPTVEVPAEKKSENVTLFYSGDGGWRDLDRTVASEMAALNYPVVGIDVLRYFWKPKTPEQTAADLASTMAHYRKKWNAKTFVLAGYSFGADILPAVYNRLPEEDKASVELLVLLGLAKSADFEIHVSGWLGKSAGERPLSPELEQIPKRKILCIYGLEEKAETACTTLQNSEAKILELPGGHHFDQDYPKLTRQILDIYRQHGIN